MRRFRTIWKAPICHYDDEEIEVVDAKTFDEVMALVRECARATTMDEAWGATEKCYDYVRAMDRPVARVESDR